MIALGLGSNSGDREAQLTDGRRQISEFFKIEVASGVYVSEPVGVTAHPWYLNQVITGTSKLSAQALLSKIKEIEAAAGRLIDAPNSSFQPRPLDIDILLFGDEIIDSPDIQIPHPRLHLRRFVLRPLAEIAPRLLHPVLKKTILDLLAECTDIHEVLAYMDQ